MTWRAAAPGVLTAFVLMAFLGGTPVWALTVDLQPEAVAGGAQVRLGEVAVIEGGAVSRDGLDARQVVLGQAPQPGEVRTFARRQVELRLWQAGFRPDEVQVTGSESVAVRRPGRPVGRTEAEALYRRRLAALLGVAEEKVTVSLVNWVEPVVPEGRLELTLLGDVAQVARSAATGVLLGPVDLLVDGEPAATLRPRALVTIKVPAVVARESLARGSVIQPGQVEAIEYELTRLPDGALRTLAEAEGAQVLRSLPAGTPLRRSDVAAPLVVRRGERVTLRLASGTLVLTAAGLALEDGSLGATIRVQNLESRRTVAGIVRGAGEILVVPDGAPAEL